MALDGVDCRAVWDLCEEARYLDAYEATRAVWEKPQSLDGYSAEELVVGSRLAEALGAGKVARWLCREAMERDAAHPMVRLFCRNAQPNRAELLGDLEEFQARPQLDSGRADLDAMWLAQQGFLWALLRDFERSGRLAPKEPSSLIVEARLHKLMGRAEEAIASLLAALWIDPGFAFCYLDAWQLANTLPLDRRREIYALLEKCLFRTIGPLHHARDHALRIATSLGVREAEQAVLRWQTSRSDDPEVVAARADLLLHRGQGRSDAARATEILQQAVGRFPHHGELRMLLAEAHGAMGELPQQRQELTEALRRHPLDTRARGALAFLLNQQGQADEAAALAGEGPGLSPADLAAWMVQADLLWEQDRRQQAIDAVVEGSKTLSESFPLLERLVDQLLAEGRGEQAVAAARQGLQARGGGARWRFLLARAIHQSSVHTDARELEDALRRVLEEDVSFLDAADMLAELLAEALRGATAPLGKFAVLGNHEFYVGVGDSVRFLELAGFRVLRQEAVTVGAGLRIAGVDDPAGRSIGGSDLTDEQAVLPAGKAAPTILLKHHPIVLDSSLGRFDLQLSGHTHGGQILPWHMVTRLAYRRYRGLYDLPGGGVLYTTTGAGTWGPALRLLARPEVAIITLTAGKRGV